MRIISYPIPFWSPNSSKSKCIAKHLIVKGHFVGTPASYHNRINMQPKTLVSGKFPLDLNSRCLNLKPPNLTAFHRRNMGIKHQTMGFFHIHFKPGNEALLLRGISFSAVREKTLPSAPCHHQYIQQKICSWLVNASLFWDPKCSAG